MFRAVSSTLSELGADPRYLGGTIGIIAILHTWTQTLSYHPHIHCIVPAGALAPDGVEWIPSRGKLLFPAEAVKQLYRGKMMAYFREAVKEGAIAMLPESDGAPGSLRKVVDALYTENWVVYLKESIASPGGTRSVTPGSIFTAASKIAAPALLCPENRHSACFGDQNAPLPPQFLFRTPPVITLCSSYTILIK